MTNLINFSNSLTEFISDKNGSSVAKAIGTHLYCELRITLSLSESALAADREKCQKSLTLFGSIGAVVANLHAGVFLEHQGSRIHLFFEGDENSSRPKARLAAMQIDESVRAKVKPVVGEGWRGHVSAQSYGPTVFVSAEDLHRDQSTVSLSHAANAPAKALVGLKDKDHYEAKGEPKGYLTKKAYADVEGFSSGSNIDEEVNDMLKRASFGDRGSIMKSAADGFQVLNEGAASTAPEHCFTFAIRADIDGFTGAVADAYGDNTKLEELVSTFLEIMKASREFAEKHPSRFIQLPWAGDCFSLLVSSADDHLAYDEARKTETATICEDFKVFMLEKGLWFNAAFKGWAFSVAGGEVNGNQKGNTMVGRLSIGGSGFIVASGRGVVRSNVGLIQASPDNDEIVMFEDDARALSPTYRANFVRFNTKYFKGSIDAVSEVNAVFKETAPRVGALLGVTGGANPWCG